MAKKAAPKGKPKKNKFGDNVVLGSEFAETEPTIIPLSPRLDIILGGGVPEGSVVIFTGQPKVGKTVSALSLASNAQQEANWGELCPNGRDVFYYDIEARFKPRDINGIKGLDKDRFHIVKSEPGKILRGEDFLQRADENINKYVGSVHIIDSFSALCTEAELTTGMDKMQRADGPKLIAKFCRKVCNIVPVNKNIVIGVTHLMGNPSGKGKAFKEKSGQAIAYAVDVKLHALFHEKWIEGDTQVGQTVHWECMTSAIGPPGRKLDSWIRYGEGIDRELELLLLAKDFGLVNVNGAWYTFLDGEGEEIAKAQGKEKSAHLLKEDTELREKLQVALGNLLGRTV